MPKVLINPSQLGHAPSKVLTGFVAAVVLVLTAWAAKTWGVAPSHAPAPVHQMLPDPEFFFARRSPGPRGSGALLQTKHAIFRLASTAMKPYERVLSNLRFPAPAAAFLPPNLLPANLLPGPGGLGLPGGGDGGGPILAGPGLPSGVTPAKPSIPEPTTWTMLIVGIFMIGFSLRRQQRLAKNAKSCNEPEIVKTIGPPVRRIA